MHKSMTAQNRKDNSGRERPVIRMTGLVLILMIFLAACTSAPGLTPTATLPPATILPPSATLPPATPTLQPATEYTEGRSEIPAGKFLFVENWGSSDGKGKCEGEAYMDLPSYFFNSGVLDAPNVDAGRGFRNSLLPPVGFYGAGGDNQGAMGGGASSRLEVIDTLPYAPMPYKEVTIHSVDAQGTIVAEIEGERRFLKSGQSWVRRFDSFPSPLCLLTSTDRLTNYGLLDQDKVPLPRANALQNPHRLVWSHDGRQLIFAGTTGVTFYSTSPLKPADRWATPYNVLNLALSPDGRRLAFSGSDNNIHLRNLSSDAAHERILTDPPGPWKSLAFSPDGSTLAAGSVDGIIQLWNSATGKAIGSPWMDRMHSVSSLSFSPDGKFLLTDDDWVIRIWEAHTGKLSRAIRMMSLNGTASYDAVWSPDGKTIAWGSYPYQGGKVVGTLDAATGGAAAALTGQNCAVWNVAYSRDSKLIGAGSNCGSVQVWDVKTGLLKGQWSLDGKGSVDLVISLAFSPDGRQLAAYDLTVPSLETIRLIDLDTGQTTLTTPDQP